MNITIRDIAVKTRFFGLHFSPRNYQCISNHFYVMGAKSYQVGQNNAKYTVIAPFEVTDFGTNRKPICNFLLVINSNLTPILHVSKFQVPVPYEYEINKMLSYRRETALQGSL